MIRIELNKSFGTRAETFNLQVAFELQDGSLTAITGASGAGKTTLLRMIAGLENPDSGIIEVNEEKWYDASQRHVIKPQDRNVGMVFQSPALFPNMTVKEQLLYSQKKELDNIIELTDIQDLINRKPHTLSGGQKQRVALARTLAQRPAMLLLDEPFSALDATTRYKLQQTLIAVHRELKLSTLIVSHDQSEVLRVADQMLVMDQGQITAQGKPVDLIGGHQLSGKFQLQGELVALVEEKILFIASVLVGNQLIKVVVDRQTAKDLQIGDKVIVASKAFNPIIQKIG